MAEAGLQHLKKLGAIHPICLSATGIAGPSGGSDLKPVGLCYIALAGESIKTECLEIRARAGLDRRQLKIFFSQKGLEMLRSSLLK